MKRLLWAGCLFLALGWLAGCVPGVVNPEASPPVEQAPSLPDSPPAVEQVPAPGTAKPVAKVPVLMYHEVGPHESQLSVDAGVFARQMEFLANEGYHPVTFDALGANWRNGEPLPPKPVIITLDDGYADNYTNAWPVLKQHGFTATVFLISDAVGQPDTLNWEQIKEMQAGGICFGSHTRDHPDLRQVSTARLEREVAGSKAELEAKLGIPVTVFCYPAGKYDDRTLTLLATNGFKQAVTTQYGFAGPEDNPLLLPRIRINRSDGYAGFVRKLKAGEKG
ncbi:MAG: polysaccharide deacetylase family protein [Heliobacteriaceae bacterium]|nr:polysaccharide deacetylase family protein [Heliobacteriaceae bacterium]